MITILVVEDESAITEMLQMVLEDAGYQVITASHGRAGLAALGLNTVDLVLCDVMMPVMGGVEFCRAIRGDPNYASIPFVFMSAAGRSPAVEGCHYRAFLSKPFMLHDLLDTVADALDNS